MLNYSLKVSDYTCKNALFYGNFYKHCQKASSGSLKDRFIHGLIVTALVLPIIGQIAALFEMIIVKCRLNPFTFKKVNGPEEAKLIIERALSCEATKLLMDLTNFISGGWQIKIVPKNSPCAAGRFGGSCDSIHKIINIRENHFFDRAFTTFVFELTNAIQFDKHRKISKKAKAGLIEEEEYVKEKERVEHEGTIMHHNVMMEAIEEKGWWKSVDSYRHRVKNDFEFLWKHHIKNSRHANYWREAYRKIAKKA